MLRVLSARSVFGPLVCLVAAFAFSPLAVTSLQSQQDGRLDSTTSEAITETEGLAHFPTTSPKLRSIFQRGTLRVGTHEDYHPFRIKDPKDGHPGIDVELGNALGEAMMDINVEWKYGNIHELFQMLQEGEIDVAFGGISSTLRRARHVRFADPYLITTPAALLSRESLPSESGSVDFPQRKFKSLGDLRFLDRLALGVIENTTNEDILRSDPQFEKHNIEPFPDRFALLEAFDNRRIDAIIADGVYIQALTLREGKYLTRAVAITGSYQEEHLCPVIAYGDAEFLQYMNFFIKEMQRTGRLEALRRKYLESDAWVK